DDDGGFNTGAVWIIFLNADGTVKAKQKISETTGGFGGSLNTNALFGSYLASLDDLDGDGVTDLVIGNYGDDDGGYDRGAAWIVFLNTDGTVKGEQKISALQGGFNGSLDNSDFFGRSVAKVGDLDGDGVTEIAVGAVNDDDGGSNRGAVWILFMNSDGTVKAEQKISDLQGGFNGTLDNDDIFGQAIASIGDVDGDGVPDLAVGSAYDDDGGTNRGALWILLMNTDGTVKEEQKISSTEGGFFGILHDSDLFGWSVGRVGDLDMDGIPDLITGAPSDDDGGADRGAVWLLLLNADGSVKAEHKISATAGGFNSLLHDGDSFGSGVTRLTDLDGNGVLDLMVSARGDDDGGNATGAVWILFLERIDSDNDDIPDSVDNCPDIANPTQEDNDNDGIGNGCDNCQDVANSDQEDADGDGFGDACDYLLLNLPEPMSIEATASSGATISYSVSATSGLDPSPIVTCTPLSGSQFPLGNTTVNCTATDTS
ncbi:MAG: hypothetical protein D3908_11575, partial [Candidatus Electrothrix sp. AUS4]|nr:hypothetical protein [Candidatus Electrothrix sp. AUS4]